MLNDEPLFGRSIAQLVEAVIARSADDTVHQSRGIGGAHAAPARSAAGNRAGRTRRRSQLRTNDSVGEGQYVDQTRPSSGAVPHAASVQPRNKTDRLRPRTQSVTGYSIERSRSDSLEADAGHEQASKRRAAKVVQLPQRAGRELLESRANEQQQGQPGNGEPQATASVPTPRSSLAAPLKTSSGPAPAKHKAVQRRAAASLHTRQSQVSTTRRAALDASSQRAGDIHSTEGPSAETFAQRLVRRTANTIRRLRSPADEEIRVSKWLGDQWSKPLAGTAVPGDWLRRLATGETSATSARQSEGDPIHSAPLAAHHQASTLQRPEENSVTRAHSIAGDSPSERERTETPAPDARDDSIGYEHEGAGETANRAGAERVAPPSLAGSLPALSPLTTPQTTVTGVLPLASETARLGALEEARPPEDLEALAAKIKFILDEQARRHGIDV